MENMGDKRSMKETDRSSSVEDGGLKNLKVLHPNDDQLDQQELLCGIGARQMPGTRTLRTFLRTCGPLSG